MENEEIYAKMKATQIPSEGLTVKRLQTIFKEMDDANRKRRESTDHRYTIMVFDDLPWLSDEEFIALTKSFKFMGGSEAYEKIMLRAKRLNLIEDEKNK
jgi:hypothetical protein